jgi:hypothetical protein
LDGVPVAARAAAAREAVNVLLQTGIEAAADLPVDLSG